ncbi:MAG: purine-nucleoside phosphorylase [Cyclobacteriaceae bacterium]|nr:purine-nucleoside phosphorylase [Cyclobacteriaceae bacterium]
MSIHISANKGDIAETVLLPGDPLRAKAIAENFLENAICYNEVRGMLGYTGEYKGKRVSVQGSGMGMPSLSIYVNELASLGAKRLIRVGTCGAYQSFLKLGDIVIAISASTDSNINNLAFDQLNFAPTANFDLLLSTYQKAQQKGLEVHVGPIFSSDIFYQDDPDHFKKWAEYGILAVEMETAALYALAAKHKIEALTILTVSDSLVTGEIASHQDREQNFLKMTELALTQI